MATANTAWLFPGQGSQTVGMGADLVAAYPEAQAVFEEADDILGFRLSTLCFEGPAEELNDTINAQPALLTTSVAILRILQAHGGLPDPQFVAGHSMGEYSALVAAGALTFADSLRLVRERGRLMKQAGELSPGEMAAILGVDDATVEEVCAAVDGVQVANYNSPGQVVISGTSAGVAAASAELKNRGARKIVPLAVSIAAHSELMRPIVEAFAEAVNQTPFQPPRVPLISNVKAQPITEVDEIRTELVEQLTSPVRWVSSIQYMIAQGVSRFLEIGPKDVLTRLMRRIDRQVEAINVGDTAAITTMLERGNHD